MAVVSILLMRNSDEITIGKTQPTLFLAPGHIRPIYRDQHRMASWNMMAKKYRQAKQVQVNENGKEKSLKKAKSVTMEMMLTQRTWLYIHSNGGFSL